MRGIILLLFFGRFAELLRNRMKFTLEILAQTLHNKLHGIREVVLKIAQRTSTHVLSTAIYFYPTFYKRKDKEISECPHSGTILTLSLFLI
jgi:hypothetical protein